MKQKVHSVSYLAKAEFELKNGVYDLVALPSGAEVVKVSLEVVGNPTTGNISVGFKDETQKNYFLTLENLTTSNNRATSAKDYTATSNKVVVAEVKNANGNDIKGVLRALYFLPSVIEVEY
ncbi:hypothetical protein VN1289_13870 [Helicobacter pylori]|nr:hypothetical protein VN1289_13870 [Helicobacter pylori]